MSLNFSPIDYTLVAIYFFTVLFIGFYVAKKNESTDDYFLAGRNQNWLSIGFSLFASNISSSTLIGLTGAAYAWGIAISNYEWMASVVLVFFAIFFIPYYLGTKIYTMPEFLERRFSASSRYYFSALTVLGNILIDTAGTLYAGSLVINFFFPQVEFWQSATILAIVAGVYTAAGGLAAVIYTDVIQAIILLIGSTAIAYLAFMGAGGDWSAIVAGTENSELALSVILPSSDPNMPWTGLITGVPILGFYFWCTNQFIVQRVLSAKSIPHARWGALFGGLLKLPVLFIMVLPGIMARKLFPDLPNPDQVFPTMIVELLPVGLKGLVMAGLIAALMSSIDSTLHSASTLVTMDFIKKLRPNIPNAKLTNIGRVITIIFMVLSVAWVPVVASYGALFNYLQNMLAYLFPPVVALFVLGLFWKRANSRGAIVGLVAGHIFSVSTFCLQQFGSLNSVINLHFLEWAGVFFIVSMVVIVIASLTAPAPAPEVVSATCWSRQSVAELTKDLPSYPLYKDYRFHSAILIALTIWLIIAFW
jgi:solute:Na+ symporter, SSS family